MANTQIILDETVITNFPINNQGKSKIISEEISEDIDNEVDSRISTPTLG